MRKFKVSKLFQKNTKKLKGQEKINFLNKFNEIISSPNIDHYKNLKHDLKHFKRVHVNNSYVILFFDKNKVIHFVDYASHDNIYNRSKQSINKLLKTKF